jgi:N,N'-diacetylchitobiose phosphorylase
MSTYGKFTKDGQFIVENPATPEPWLHYLIRVEQPGTETFCSGVTCAGGGFDMRGTHENTFVDTQIHLNDADNVGRYVYIVDKGTGGLFTTTWQPVRNPKQTFKATLGFGTLLFESECNELVTKTVMFVPKQFDGWIQNISIYNGSKEVKELSIFPFIPIHMGDALIRLLAGDNFGFFGGAVYDRDLKAIVFRCNNGIPAGDDQKEINGLLGNVAAFYSTLNNNKSEYETSLEHFLGDRFHDLSNPCAILGGKLSSKDRPHLRRTCGAFKNEVVLHPGETVEFAVALAAGSTKDYYLNGKQQLKRILSELGDEQKRAEMLAQVTDWWKRHMDHLAIQSPDEKINRAFKWLQYQCHIVYILNRMKSRFHTGYEYGWGFRDILQDVLFNLPYDSGMVAKALKHISTQMFSNGAAYHNFFIHQPGNRNVEASDDPIWFPNAVFQYCKESGDFAFLNEVTDYAEVHEGQAGIQGTILDHCLKAVERAWEDRSPRGLSLLKDCDWNDDLNTRRVDGKPNDYMESIMVSQQLYRCLLDMARLFEASGLCTGLISEYEQRAASLKTAINAYAMDEAGYYKRVLSLDPLVEDLGCSKNQFGKIFLETQCFAILSGVADKEQGDQALDAVQKYLDTEFGAALCTPVFTDLAERNLLPKRTWSIEKEPPGIKENGSIFMHLNAWLIQAYAVQGRGREAVAHYSKILPENLSVDQDRYKAEPFVYPEFVRGSQADEFGRGGHTWLTGTAPTMHQALVQYIFGLRPDYGGLIVDPCVDPAWNEFSVKREFRGATYLIRVENPDHCEQGVRSIKVDGKLIHGNMLPIFQDGATHLVDVVMGVRTQIAKVKIKKITRGV